MVDKRTEVPIKVTGFPWCAKAITPDNTALLTNHQGEQQPQTVRVGGTGTVRYQPMGNDTDEVINQSFVAGEIIPCLVVRVHATGTTATNLVGYF